MCSNVPVPDASLDELGGGRPLRGVLEAPSVLVLDDVGFCSALVGLPSETPLDEAFFSKLIELPAVDRRVVLEIDVFGPVALVAVVGAIEIRFVGADTAGLLFSPSERAASLFPSSTELVDCLGL